VGFTGWRHLTGLGAYYYYCNVRSKTVAEPYIEKDMAEKVLRNPKKVIRKRSVADTRRMR